MVGLGPVRNQVSAAKKLQTPSRTATTIIMLVPFAAANKLLARAGWAIASVVAARCGSRALLLGLTPFLRVRTCRVGCA